MSGTGRLAGYQSDRSKRQRIVVFVALGVGAFFYSLFFSVLGPFWPTPFAVPLITLLMLIIWALPDRVAPKENAYIPTLFIGFLIALCCWPDYLALSLPGAPWITAVRLTSFPLAMIFLMEISTSKQFRQQLSEILRDSIWITRLVIAFTVIFVLSVGWSAEIGFSTGRMVKSVTTWTLMFFVAAVVFTKPGRVTQFAYLLWGIVIFLSLVGLWELSLGHVPWFDNVPAFLNPDPETFEKIVRPKFRTYTQIYRIQAVQTTPLGLAELFALALPFIFQIAFSARNRVVVICAWLTVPLIFYIISMTDSRLGTVGFILGVTLFAFAIAMRRSQVMKNSLLAPIIYLSFPAVMAFLFVGSFFIGRLRHLVWGDGSQQASTDSRFEQWDAGLDRFFAQPWGYGIGRGAETLGWASGAGNDVSIDSYFLSILLEYGLIGFVVFTSLFVVAIVMGLKRVLAVEGEETIYLIPVTISLIVFVVIKLVFSQEANHPFIFILLGLMVALLHRHALGEGSVPAGPQARTGGATRLVDAGATAVPSLPAGRY